jgi:hypothetical protein
MFITTSNIYSNNFELVFQNRISFSTTKSALSKQYTLHLRLLNNHHKQKLNIQMQQ